MTHQVTVGITQDPQAGHFPVDASIKDVTATGSFSNQVHVGETAPNTDPVPEIHSGSIGTTQGPATVRTHANGTTLVTLPSGLEVSLEEAVANGLIAEGDASSTGEPDAPNEGSEDGDVEAVVPTVDEAELNAHASELNAAGEALEAAGLDAEDALSRSVEGIASDGELPEDVSDALVEAFGEEDAQAITDNAFSHAQALTADAISAAGLSLNDMEAMQGLEAELDALPMTVWIDAIRGNPQGLNDAVSRFASSRSA